MSTMITEVYDAFLSAGADDDKARQAATAVADIDGSLKTIETSLMSIEKSIANLKWTFGLCLGLILAVLLFIADKI